MKRILVFFFLISVPLLAAKTGAITGKITDANTGKPLPGVNVLVNGTNRGATANRKGEFLIKKVPVGSYTVSANLIGYKPANKKDVKVRVGKTTRLSFKLSEQKAKGEAVTIIADKPLNSNKVKARHPKRKLDTVTTEMIDIDTPPEDGLSKSTPKNDSDTKPALIPTPPLPSESGETEGDEATEAIIMEPDNFEILLPEKVTASEKASKPAPVRPKKYSSDKADMTIKPTPGPARPPKKRPAPRGYGGLKAGSADDNKQFNYFLSFLVKYAQEVDFYPYDISERIQLVFEDREGRSLPNVEVEIRGRTGQVIDSGLSYSDGSFFLFPAEIARTDQVLQVGYTINGVSENLKVQRYGPRKIVVKDPESRQFSGSVPVDIVFILDTTGSMGEEIKRLLETIEIIHMNLIALPNIPEVRFGMILYRDRNDSYVTRVIHPTSNIDKFRKALAKVEADGGGDTPEDLQSALEASMEAIEWNRDGLRLGFVITDATAHLDYGQEYTYIKAAETAKRKGIKLFTVGTGGLAIDGEYILRQISQLTYAKYLFLTYGQERGENAGGRAGSVSHHTGSNYQTDKLEAIIIKIAKEEISNFTDEPFEAGEDYFQAESVDHESREETLSFLFRDALNRMVDYSTLKIEKSPKLGVLPVVSKTGKLDLSAEYFTEQLQLSVSKNDQFTLIARKDLQKILEEQKLQLSGLLDQRETIQLGELLGAELLLSGELYEQPAGYDLFLKLLRVETAEILAVTKIVMDKNLGL